VQTLAFGPQKPVGGFLNIDLFTEARAFSSSTTQNSVFNGLGYTQALGKSARFSPQVR
jgi:hypothetical protein